MELPLMKINGLNSTGADSSVESLSNRFGEKITGQRGRTKRPAKKFPIV